ncbi:MAG: YhfC family intramembrane metalloprotease [Solobacterium sp.]|nr:YhfC family intramembrane metalloprotease [Solobacterium sp.]
MTMASGIFTVLCTLVLPLGVSLYLCCCKKRLLKPVLLGAATFFVFQMLIRIPLIQLVLPNMQWYLKLEVSQPLFHALFLGVTAALAEELGRYFVMTMLLKKNRRIEDGIAFGVGHGGIEAILLVGINTLFTVILSPASIAPGLMFACGIERLAAMAIHVGWSVMVMKSIREKKIRWLFLALFTHTIIDCGVSYASNQGLSIWIIEGFVLLCAAIGILFVIKQNKTKENV